MSLYEYMESRRITLQDFSFYALIMAAMRKADSDNLPKLQEAFPETWGELAARYDAPGGVLENENHVW